MSKMKSTGYVATSCVASCAKCDWEHSHYGTAMVRIVKNAARKHAEAHGHDTSVEVVSAFHYTVKDQDAN